MANASLSKIKDIIYENLSVATSYGNMAANARFKTEHVDDAIVASDIKVLFILKRNKKDALLGHLVVDSASPTPLNLASGTKIPDGVMVILSVFKATQRLVELPYTKYRILDRFNGEFDSSVNNKYYAIEGGKIYHSAGGDVNITYIPAPTYPATLVAGNIKSPQGFENIVASFATAQLLMKRMDRPEEAEFYSKQAYSGLQEYGIQESPISDSVDIR